MKRYTLISALLLGLGAHVHTQVTEDWVSPDFNYGLDGIMVTTDQDDNTYTVSDIAMGDIYLTKRNTAGTILWTATYDNTTPSQWEQASAVAIDKNGDAIVTGYTNVGFGTDWFPVQMVTMKFSGTDGSLIWRETYSTAVAYRGRRILTDNAGNIYIGGDVNAWMIYHGEVGNMMVKKYDTDGNDLWTITTDAGGNVMGGTLRVMDYDADSNIVISSLGSSLAKVSRAGSVLWHVSGIEYGIKDISQDPSGNIFVLSNATFGAPPALTTDITVKKYTSAGTLMWTNHYDFGYEDFALQIECDGTGGAYIIGYNNIYFNWLTFKINGSGVQQWMQVYDEHTGNDEIPRKMVKDADDNIYVTGQGGPWPGYFWLSLVQMVTIKYTPAGVEEWVALHTTYSNTGSDIILASDNSIYALGQQYAVLIHYDQVVPATCDVPVGLFTNNITTTKARLNWTMAPGVVQYEIWYKKVTAINWKKKFVPGTSNKLTLKNLSCNTNYVWKIRALCDTVGVDLASDFSADQFFTTAVCREGDLTTTQFEVLISPNPAQDMITIDPNGQEFTSLTVYDLSGNKVIESKTAFSEPLSLNVQLLPNGLYVIRLSSVEGITTKQVIITH